MGRHRPLAHAFSTARGDSMAAYRRGSVPPPGMTPREIEAAIVAAYAHELRLPRDWNLGT